MTLVGSEQGQTRLQPGGTHILVAWCGELWCQQPQEDRKAQSG